MSTSFKAGAMPLSRSAFDALPDSAFVRIKQLVLPRKSARAGFAILPMSAATVWRKVKNKSFPEPKKISEGITGWTVADVRHWLSDQAAAGYTPACQSADVKKAEGAARRAVESPRS